MNSTDHPIVSTSVIFGALISALTFRFFSSNSKTPKSRRVTSEIAAISRRFSILDPFSPSKREGYLSWDDYFMAIAFLSAERSKDQRIIMGCISSKQMVYVTPAIDHSGIFRDNENECSGSGRVLVEDPPRATLKKLVS